MILDFLPSQITPMESLFAGEVFGPGIKILLLSFEIFVVVSEEARGRTSDVRFALHVASVSFVQRYQQDSTLDALNGSLTSVFFDLQRMEKSRSIGATRPFNPPVHALILPSKIPSDLKPYFRYLEEDEIVRFFHISLFILTSTLVLTHLLLRRRRRNRTGR